jgi:hypothetical protein
MTRIQTLHRAVLVVASLCAFAARPTFADPTKPERKPKDAASMHVTILVPYSALGLGSGRGEVFSGKVHYWPNQGPTWVMLTDLALKDATGRTLSPQTGLTFRLSKEKDAAGGQVEMNGVEDLANVATRIVHESDVALLPLRALVPNVMPSGSGRAAATKELNHEHYHVEISEKYIGAEQISMTPLHRNFTRSVRTLRPSGFQVIDYVLTYEDERDASIMASYAVRMFVHPTATLQDGTRPPAGVFHIEYVHAYQLDWLKEAAVIEGPEWVRRSSKWTETLADQLFFGMAKEGVGDPFDAPSAFALRALRVLSEGVLARLVNIDDGHPKLLAQLTPQLLDLPLSFDPARFVAAHAKTEDPAQRLLLAAAAVLAGTTDEALLRECEIALYAKDDTVRRAALALARALRAESLVLALEKIAASATADDDRALAFLTLGAIGTPEAVAAVDRALAATQNDKTRAAGLRALADAGAEGFLERYAPNVKFGAMNPSTGQFELLPLEAKQAQDALAQLADLSRTLQGDNVGAALSAIKRAMQGETSTDRVKAAVGRGLRDRLGQLGAWLPKVGEFVEDEEFGATVRRMARACGREAIPQILQDLESAQGEARIALAKLAGTTRDPRATAVFERLAESDSDEDVAIADAGKAAARRD